MSNGSDENSKLVGPRKVTSTGDFRTSEGQVVEAEFVPGQRAGLAMTVEEDARIQQGFKPGEFSSV